MSFLESLDFGKGGEAYLIDWLGQRGVEVEYVNERGYDLFITSTGIKVETKSDRYALYTNNILFELWSHIDRKSPGWVQHSPAEVLCYLLYNRKGEVEEVLFYDFPMMRSFLLWVVLGGSWYNQPIMGELKNARAAGSPKAVNLLLPKHHLRSFELPDDWWRELGG